MFILKNIKRYLQSYVTVNNETQLRTKKSISKFSPFLIENPMGIRWDYPQVMKMILRKVIAILA